MLYCNFYALHPLPWQQVRATTLKLVGELAEWIDNHHDVLGMGEARMGQSYCGSFHLSLSLSPSLLPPLSLLPPSLFPSSPSLPPPLLPSFLSLPLLPTDLVLQFILAGLKIPAVATYAAKAVQSVCEKCKDRMAPHFDGLLQVGREGGREGGRERGRKGGRERGREGGREGERERGREGGREGGR